MSTATASLTPVFVRLKLSLLRNGLRQSTKRKAVYIVSWALTALVAALQLLGLAALHGHAHAAALTVPLMVLLALGWAFLPLFFPSGDETLDPTRLVMLPLKPGPLIRALLLTSLIGIGPAFTLVIIIGSVIGTAHGPAAALAGIPATVLTLLICVALARAVATANVRLLSSRKGRDLALLSGVVIAVGVQFVNLALRALSDAGLARLEPVADVLGWVPPGSALGAVRSAGEGSYGLAAAQLALAVAALAALLQWWQSGLTKLMTSPDSSTIAASRPGKAPARSGTGLARLLPEGRTGAVMLRTLRYAWRDPKTKMSWTTQLAVGVIVPFVNAAQGNGSIWFVLMPASLLGVLMYNQFGQDTSAFWMVLQTIGTTRDAYLELRARALALALVMVPYLVLLVTALAAFTGDWPNYPVALGLSLALIGGLFATGALASARYPYSIPQGSAFKNVAPGQTALAWFSMLGVLVAAALCAPLGALAIGFHLADAHGLLPLLLPLGIGYGLLLAWVGLRLAAPRVVRRLPEILTAVSK